MIETRLSDNGGEKLPCRIVDFVATVEEIESETMACDLPLLPCDICDGATND
jgi:hypothetical protein